MSRSSSFISYQQGAQAAGNSARTTQGVTDFLRAHDKLTALLPTVTRLVALQKDCVATLPTMFDTCVVLQFDESGQLTIAITSAALAAKLKQQLPKLQDSLCKRGWQVSAIRLKVQVTKIPEKSMVSRQLTLPQQAISALGGLASFLNQSPHNERLAAAVATMLQRHRSQK